MIPGLESTLTTAVVATAGAPASAAPELLPALALAVAVLLCFSAFFSSSETVVLLLKRRPLEREKLRGQAPGAAARIEALAEDPPRTLASVLTGNELVNVSLSMVCATIVLTLWPEQAWMNLLIATPLLIVFGEVLPKTLAFRFPLVWSRLFSRPLKLWTELTSPLRWVLLGVAGLFLRYLGARGEDGVGLHERAFRRLVDEGRHSGDVAELEQEIIHRVFEFGEMPVSRMMTPRPDVVAAPLTIPYPELVARVRDAGVSRVPIYDGDPDDVVGVLLTKDLLQFVVRGDGDPPDADALKALLQEPLFIPTSKPAEDLLREFRERRVHIALVVDEHGSLVGLVTMDDLLQELMGDLAEDDEDSEEIERIHPDTWTVSGAMDIEDFAEETGISLPNGDYRTVGGFVFSRIGHLPAAGEAVVHEGVAFTVTSVEGRRIIEISAQIRPAGAA